MYWARAAAPSMGMALYSEARMPPVSLWPLTFSRPRAAAHFTNSASSYSEPVRKVTFMQERLPGSAWAL